MTNQIDTQPREWLKRQYAARPEYEQWQPTPLPESFAALIEKRKVRKWEDFDERTKGVYRHIASLFPASPVYACGSRVRGDRVEYLDKDEVRQWRAMIGKTDKDVSDYDFWATPDAEQIEELPRYADRIRHGIPEDEKILIPMPEWDFTKLPESEHARVIDLYNRGRWGELANIHDQYNISPYSYCCDLSGLKVWYKFGIQQGKIKINGGTADTGI